MIGVEPGLGDSPALTIERADLERFAEVLVAAGAPGAAVMVRARGDTRHAVRGFADLRTCRPMRPDLRFRAGSITKSFVAAVVLQLVDEGWLALSDTVERWVPGALPYADEVTLRQLLNHTSGVPDFVSILEDRHEDLTPHELVALVGDAPPRFARGTGWAYSNTGYVLLGLVVEALTGEPLEDELADRICRPLGLACTSFPLDDTALAPPMAHGYAPALGARGAPLVDVTTLNPSWAWACGELVSTLDELTRFFGALLGGELLSPALLAEMQTTVAVPPESHPVPLYDSYGLGLVGVELPRGRLFGHPGGIPGYLCAALSTEDGQRQLAVMVNVGDIAPHPVYDALVAVSRSLATLLTGRPPRPEGPPQ